MSDDLERLRRMADDAPAPSTEWIESTRDELLAMAAAEERDHPAAATDVETTPHEQSTGRSRTRGWWSWLRRPGVLAGAAAAAAVVVGVGITLDGGLPGGSPTPAPTATAERYGSEAPGAGASGEAMPPPATGDTPRAAESLVLDQQCSVADEGLTVSYPAGWHTGRDPQVGACRVFDDQPVDLEVGIGGQPLGPVRVDVLDDGLDRVTTAAPTQRELSRSDTRVAGRPAVVVEWEATGEGAGPAGLQSHRVFVDLDDRTLMLAGYAVEDHDFEVTSTIVDRMAASVRLAEPTPSTPSAGETGG